MKIAFFLLLSMFALSAFADDAGPVILVFPEEMDITPVKIDAVTPMANAYAMVGGIANSYLDKKNAKFSALWRQQLGAQSIKELYDLADKQLACVGLPEKHDSCRDYSVVAENQADIAGKLTSSSAHKLTLIVVNSEFDGGRLIMRAVASDFTLQDSKVSLQRNYSALYSSRAPEDLIKRGKKHPELLTSYWTQARIFDESKSGMKELAEMLSALALDIDSTGNAPAKWANLTKLNDLEAAHQLKCPGWGCERVTRLYKEESDDRRWFLYVGDFKHTAFSRDKGFAMASLDSSTAKLSTNLMIWVQFGLTAFM